MSLDHRLLAMQVNNVASLPMIFVRINEAVNSPRSSMGEIAKVISEDDSGRLASPPPAVQAELPDLLAELQTTHKSVWKELQEHMVIDEIRSFGQTLGTLGREYHLEALRHWGVAIEKYAAGCQIDELTRRLREYLQVVEDVRTTIEQWAQQEKIEVWADR